MVILNSILLFTILVFLYYVSWHKKYLLHPVFIISVWWLIWLTYSISGLSGLNIPSQTTLSLFLTMILSINIGSLFKLKMRDNFLSKDAEFENKKKKVLKLGVFLLTPTLIILGYRAFIIIIDYGIQSLRDMALTFVDKESTLFGSGALDLLFHITLYPLMFFGFFSSIGSFFKGEKLFFISYVIIILIYSFILQSRIILYAIIIIFLYSLFLRKKTSPFLIAIPLLAGSVMLLVAMTRGSNITLAIKHFFDYHNIGILIFDDELNNPESRMNNTITFGRSIIGGLDQIFALVVHKIGFPEYDPVSLETGRYLHIARDIGNNTYYNAFATALHTLYIDGRLYFVIIFPILFGILINTSFINYIKYKSENSFLSLITLTYLGIFSIFQSPIESIWFWELIFLIVFCNFSWRLPRFKTN